MDVRTVDEYGNSTVRKDSYKTDSAALTEEKIILSEDINTLIRSRDGKGK